MSEIEAHNIGFSAMAAAQLDSACKSFMNSIPLTQQRKQRLPPLAETPNPLCVTFLHFSESLVNFKYQPFKYMHKLINVLLKLSLALFLLTGLLGFYYLSGGQEADALLCAKVGCFASLIFSTIAIFEVMTLENMRFSKKLIWIVSIILFQIFTALAYYLVDRKSIKYAEQPELG